MIYLLIPKTKVSPIMRARIEIENLLCVARFLFKLKSKRSNVSNSKLGRTNRFDRTRDQSEVFLRNYGLVIKFGYTKRSRGTASFQRENDNSCVQTGKNNTI